MKSIFLLLIFLVPLISFSKKDTTVYYYNYKWEKANKKAYLYVRKAFDLPNGTVGVKDYTRRGILVNEGAYETREFENRTGKFIHYDEYSGSKKSEGAYQNGQKEGVWCDFYRSGVLMDSTRMVKGKLEGEFKKWFENGVLMIHAYYKEDKYDGQFERYSDEGQLLETGTYDEGNKVGEWKEWFSNGQQRSIGSYEEGNKTGEWRKWFDNGNVDEEGEYKLGKMEGEWHFFYPSGNLSAREFYFQGEPEKIQFFDENGDQEPYDGGPLEVDPQYVGGEPQMMFFLQKNLMYPTEAMERGVQGTVYIGFYVGVDGMLEDIKVLKSAHPLLDEEALRVIKMMPKWQAGISHNRTLRIQFVVPINFKLG